MRYLVSFQIVTCCFLALASGGVSRSQQMSSFDRGRALDMLQTISNDVKKHYYDPKFHGNDFEAKIAEAKQSIHCRTPHSASTVCLRTGLQKLNSRVADDLMTDENHGGCTSPPDPAVW